MDSTLELESIYGEGSTFSFKLKQKVSDKTPIGDFEKARATAAVDVKVFHEDFTAPDASILVVDDVDLNLKVFKGLLKRSGMKITTADSGKKAIELVRNNRYDVIFMDHQMPEMDGIETLEKLLKDPDALIDDIPVIALTANAIAGARDMYLQKGFSDYLTKPVDGWALLGILHKWLPQEKIQEISEAKEPVDDQDDDDDDVFEFLPVEADADMDTENNKKECLDRLKALGLDTDAALVYAGNSEDFYFELLNDFVNDFDDRSAALNNLLSAQNWKDYEVRVHALKSISKTIGAVALSEEAKTLESAAKDDDMFLLESGHPGLIKHYASLCSAISQALE